MRYVRWDQVASTEVTNEIVKHLSLEHARQINDAATRERVTAYLSSDNVLALCDLNPSYGEIATGDAYHVRQINAFYKKRADLELGIDRRGVALGKFKEAERLCLETNTIFQAHFDGKFQFTNDVEAQLHRAQRKIAEILGDVPKLEDLSPHFGPGATTQVKRRNASARRKLSQPFACSEELLPLVRECIEELQGLIPFEEGKDLCSVPVEIHPGRLDFVRKTYATDRTIVLDPWLNGIYQLAIGDHMAVRLRRYGVDISDQSRNQRLALEGSLSNALATLDLSSASDTVALYLVMALLPIDWFIFLSLFRTGTAEMDGQSVRLEKFSSMGNGFTFPLETLIFYALAHACVEDKDLEKVSVYGDDIIVPCYAYPSLVQLLHCCGFIPNVEKSFADGPFRESCGADYLSGINIRPVYQKTALHGFDLFRIHNFYVREGRPELAEIVLSYLDPSMRIWGPDGYGDGHLVTQGWRKWGQPYRRDRGYAGYIFETYSFKGRRDYSPLPGDRILPAYSIYAAHGSQSREIESAHDRSRPRVNTNEMFLRQLANMQLREPVQTAFYGKAGALGVSVPGVKGYKSVKIYTLMP